MRRLAAPILLLLIAPVLAGCASAARNTDGFALAQEGTLPAGFDASWQAVKHVLREQDIDLYTRDKRGTFVAFTRNDRIVKLNRKRVKHTITLEALGDEATKVRVESVRQVYGVTFLTTPGWHDRKMDDPVPGKALIDAFSQRIESGADAAVEAPAAAPAA